MYELDVLPSAALKDPVDGYLRYPVALSKHTSGHEPRDILCSDRYDLCLRQDGRADRAALRVPVLRYLVGLVARGVREEQMRLATAGRAVARVADLHPRRNGAVGVLPNDNMRTQRLQTGGDQDV